MEENKRNLVAALIAISLTAFLFIVFGNKDDSETPNLAYVKKTYVNTNMPTEKPTEMTIEEKLAFLDAGRRVDKDDIKVVRIRFLLSELSNKWNEPVSEIADNTSRAQGLLKEKGVNESCLTILEEMNKVVSASPFITQNSKYLESLVLYISARSM